MQDGVEARAVQGVGAEDKIRRGARMRGWIHRTSRRRTVFVWTYSGWIDFLAPALFLTGAAFLALPVLHSIPIAMILVALAMAVVVDPLSLIHI